MTWRWLGWGVAVGLAVTPIRSAHADEPRSTEPAVARSAATPDVALAERAATIRKEFEAQQSAARYGRLLALVPGGQKAARTLAPDDVGLSRQMVDLALTNPSNPAARDALIWVLDKRYRGEGGPFGDEFARAAALLVRHHADDPVAVAVAFGLEHSPSLQRDAFLFSLVAAARSRETRGMARLALARYLEKKAEFAQASRNHRERKTIIYLNALGVLGKSFNKEVPEPDDFYAFRLATSFCDADALRAEVDRLYREIIAEYADVQYQSMQSRKMEALLREPNPLFNGRPLSTAERRKAEEMARQRVALGPVAEGYLDQRAHVAAGKPAPSIEGTDPEGNPLRLADYRGKVVVLVFWGSWCGPCLAEIPQERALAAKYRDQPFALLGVNARDTPEAARRAIAAYGITWPNWLDGDGGPIVTKYHVEGFPTVCVIDHEGTLRGTNVRGEALDRMIDQLLADITRTR